MTDQPLEHLHRLIGTWVTESSHPAMPGITVHGTAAGEWLEGERFLILRWRQDHPDFPDSISVIGVTDADRVDAAGAREAPSGESLTMHYFDSRGVFRVYEASVDDEAWRFWREAPGFSQRFTGTFADGGSTIEGLTQMRPDDVHWEDDLQVTFRRR